MAQVQLAYGNYIVMLVLQKMLKWEKWSVQHVLATSVISKGIQVSYFLNNGYTQTPVEHLVTQE